MYHLIRLSLFVFLLLPTVAMAASLSYSVSGLEGEAEQNVLAWLGTAPDTEQERLNFMVSARDRIERSLQAVGYYHPQIDIDVQRSEPVWQMAITVDPGEPVLIHDMNVQILGPGASDPEFAHHVTEADLSSGDILHHGRFDSFRDRLLSLGQRRGYLEAKIALSRVEVDVGAGTADIFIRFDSGPRYRFGELIHDDEIVDAELIDQLRTFKEGDFFEQVKLQEFQAQLQRTQFFSSVIVQPQRERAEGGQVPIILRLQPIMRHAFDVGLGYSTDTEERVSLTWRTPRINRHGHSQVTRLEYSGINPSGRITYSIPLTHPLNDVLQLWARTEENEFGDLDSSQDELGTRREIRQGKWIHSYSLRGLHEAWEVLGESQKNDYLLFGGSLSHRAFSGSILDPSSGFNQLYDLEVANKKLGSDVDLIRVKANLRYVFTPRERHRLVSRAELGVAEIPSGDRKQLAPSLNFFAGGNQSIRGFSYQSIGNEVEYTEPDGSTRTLVVGGDRLVTASLEYQYYFTETWRGALFTDGGDAFDDGEFELNYGAGFGIHYISPVGAVRVEFANSLSDDNPDWRLHLTIGAEF